MTCALCHRKEGTRLLDGFMLCVRCYLSVLARRDAERGAYGDEPVAV